MAIFGDVYGHPKYDTSDDDDILFTSAMRMLISFLLYQARIAQLVAYRLETGEVPGSNPGKGENFSMKLKYMKAAHSGPTCERM